MSIRIVKVTKEVAIGTPGSTIIGMIQQGAREAERRVVQEGGVILPSRVKVLVTIEQEYETGK